MLIRILWFEPNLTSFNLKKKKKKRVLHWLKSILRRGKLGWAWDWLEKESRIPNQAILILILILSLSPLLSLSPSLHLCSSLHPGVLPRRVSGKAVPAALGPYPQLIAEGSCPRHPEGSQS